MIVPSEQTLVTAVLQSACRQIGEKVIFHPHFQAAKLRVLEALETDNLVLLTGPAGVGKGALIRVLVDELNAPVHDNPRILRAAAFAAPSPHRRSFSWRAFWIDWHDALEDPMLGRKADMTETKLRRSAYSAARDRGTEVIVVDEARMLLMNEQGRTLCDQLDVIRDMADNSGCKIVLVSTPRILEPLNLSGELIRRMVKVFFYRYTFTGDVRDEDFQMFRMIVNTFMELLPKAQRPRLSSRRIQYLQAGSIGCVGLLSMWFVRALTRCVVAGSEAFEWSHFEERAFSDADLERFRDECEKGEKLYHESNVRTPEGLFGQKVSLDMSSEEPVPEAPATGKVSRKRVGKPNPARHEVKIA